MLTVEKLGILEMIGRSQGSAPPEQNVWGSTNLFFGIPVCGSISEGSKSMDFGGKVPETVQSVLLVWRKAPNK